MFTHVIFDLDGTLLNTLDDLADSANHVCSVHGWPTHPVEAYKQMVGGGIPNLVARFAPDGLSVEELARVREEFLIYYDRHKEDKTAPYNGMPQVVNLLKASGVGVSVLTNKADAMARSVVDHYYPGVFDAVLGALPGVPVKPDPAMLGMLMKKVGAKPETTLFVGDSNVDIRTGKNGGLATCGVLWGFRSRDELDSEGADYLVENPAELLEIVIGTQLILPGNHDKAACLLASGKLVAVPTETVYGLASDATLEESVNANYEAKGRPETKPLSVLVDGMAMVESVCKDIPLDSYKLAEAFWPGPLTMILQGNGSLPGVVTAGGQTQGVRCPDHPDTLAVIKALGKPLACPSANLSGLPSPKSAHEVLAQLAGRIDAVLDGGPCSVGVESTLLDMTAEPYRILRQGGLSREQIVQALGKEVLPVSSVRKNSSDLIVIGITGPTGAGKTTVLKVLMQLGGVILDCDAVYHELTSSNEAMRSELRDRFGDEVFEDSGELARKKLGAIVFSDPQALEALNEITHRYVRREVEQAIQQARDEGRAAVAVDAIALLESGLGELCDVTVAVTADDELRIQRIMRRDGIDEEYARKRVTAQKPSKWFEEHCDHTLRNDGPDPTELEEKAKQLFDKMINKEVV